MDFYSAIIALSLIFISVIPFFFMIRNNKKKEKGFLNDLKAIAGMQNQTIAQFDTLNHGAIGTNPEMDMIFFAKRTKEEIIQQHVDLSEIQRCKVVPTTRSVSHQGGNFQLTDKLELTFSLHGKTQPDVAFNFFDVNTDGLMITKELRLAEKWCEMINTKVGTLVPTR
jgi:hypothetical protein